MAIATYSKTVNVFGELIEQANLPYYKPHSRPTKFKTKNMQQKAAMFSSAKQDWTTPLWLYQELCKERGIEKYDTDPATNKNNPLGCKTYYTIEDDGLDPFNEWSGCVFINPPFGWGYYKGKWTYITGLWIEQAYKRCFESSDDIEMITMIIPSSVSTNIYHKYCWDYKEARARDRVRVNFYPKRIKFGGSKMVAPFNTMIIDFDQQGDAVF